MHVYMPARPQSSGQQAKNLKRRYSADQWSRLRERVDRERRGLEATSPHSPRVKVSLASFLTEEGVR